MHFPCRPIKYKKLKICINIYEKKNLSKVTIKITSTIIKFYLYRHIPWITNKRPIIIYKIDHKLSLNSRILIFKCWTKYNKTGLQEPWVHYKSYVPLIGDTAFIDTKRIDISIGYRTIIANIQDM